MKRWAKVMALPAVIALVVAGCGSNNNSGDSANASTQVSQTAYGGGYGGGGTTTAPAKKGATVVSVRNTKLGKILVGKNGRTLYLFEKDKGGKSKCSGACAAAWPPLTTNGTVKAGAGVKTAKLKMVKRSDGTKQVVYAGHPLYFYAGDAHAGQTKGQGLDQFGAEWYVVSPHGSKVEQHGKS